MVNPKFKYLCRHIREGNVHYSVLEPGRDCRGDAPKLEPGTYLVQWPIGVIEFADISEDERGEMWLKTKHHGGEINSCLFDAKVRILA